MAPGLLDRSTPKPPRVGAMRLLICHGEWLLLDALSQALTDTGHTVVATALDPDSAVMAARQHQPDACLIDVTFPHGTGILAINRIHDVSPDAKVVMLSGSISPELVMDSIAHGAQGVVGTRKPVAVLLAALEMACQGDLAVDLAVLQDLVRSYRQCEDPLPMMKLLTERQTEALGCIMEGLDTEQIAQRLGVRRSTAATHVQNVLAKLGVHSRLQAAALLAEHPSMDPRHAGSR